MCIAECSWEGGQASCMASRASGAGGAARNEVLTGLAAGRRAEDAVPRRSVDRGAGSTRINPARRVRRPGRVQLYLRGYGPRADTRPAMIGRGTEIAPGLSLEQTTAQVSNSVEPIDDLATAFRQPGAGRVCAWRAQRTKTTSHKTWS